MRASADRTSVLWSYLVFGVGGYGLLQVCSDRGFSTILTVSSCVQMLGTFLLQQKARSTRSVAGISSLALEMQVLVLLFRLSSTLCMHGYLPLDRSGDWVYQAADIGTLCLVIQVLALVHVTYKDTYQWQLDTLPIWKAIPGCVLLAVLFHGDLNHAHVLDTTWQIGCNVDTIALLPQLYLFSAHGGPVDAMNAHYVACNFVSCVLKLCFWYYGAGQMGPRQSRQTYFILVGYWVVFCHAAQAALAADFMWHYARTCWRRVVHGGPETVDLGPALSV